MVHPHKAHESVITEQVVVKAPGIRYPRAMPPRDKRGSRAALGGLLTGPPGAPKLSKEARSQLGTTKRRARPRSRVVSTNLRVRIGLPFLAPRQQPSLSFPMLIERQDGHGPIVGDSDGFLRLECIAFVRQAPQRAARALILQLRARFRYEGSRACDLPKGNARRHHPHSGPGPGVNRARQLPPSRAAISAKAAPGGENATTHPRLSRHMA